MKLIKINDEMISVNKIYFTEIKKTMEEFNNNFELKKLFLKKHTNFSKFEDVGLVNETFRYIYEENTLEMSESRQRKTSKMINALNNKIEYQLVIILSNLNYKINYLLNLTSEEIFNICFLESIKIANKQFSEIFISIIADEEVEKVVKKYRNLAGADKQEQNESENLINQLEQL